MQQEYKTTQTAPNDPPRTIAQMRALCESKGLPLAQMRFFIGEDCREACCFGIFENERGEFVVYKNKNDGSRAVRYQGYDEAYAVGEIYARMMQEIAHQRSLNEPYHPDKKAIRRMGIFVAVLTVIAIAVVTFVILNPSPRRGYYSYDGDDYYYQSGDWYWYDTAAYCWLPAMVDDAFIDNYDDYWLGADYYDDYGVEDFEDSVYYEEPSRSDDDSYDYGGSWDSGSTDWSSDW